MRDEAGVVSKAQLTQGLSVKEFGLYPETSGEPLMSFEQWRNIIHILVNIAHNVENGFEVVKTETSKSTVKKVDVISAKNDGNDGPDWQRNYEDGE